jgi:sporulation protein YlmC with PRC-barrel domain
MFPNASGMEIVMKYTVAGFLFASLACAGALAQSAQKSMSSIPDSVTIKDYYNQNVYDPGDTKIGSIEDVLLDKDGRVAALIVGVGGFLGAGEKDVAAPFSAIKGKEKNGKWYLTMNATKDELKNASGFKYDRATTKWVPDK